MLLVASQIYPHMCKSIPFQSFPATSLHISFQMDLLQEAPQKTLLCFRERRVFAQRQNHDTAAFTFASHSISMLVKAIGTSVQTSYDKAVYATPEMMTFG